MTYIAVAYVVVPLIVIAYIVIALYTYGLCSCGLYSYGLHTNVLYSYGLCSHYSCVQGSAGRGSARRFPSAWTARMRRGTAGVFPPGTRHRHAASASHLVYRGPAFLWV